MVGVAYVNVRVSMRFKEELAWVTDKRLWLIINVFKTVIPLRILKAKFLNLKQYCMRCNVTLSNIFYLLRTKMCMHSQLKEKYALHTFLVCFSSSHRAYHFLVCHTYY